MPTTGRYAAMATHRHRPAALLAVPPVPPRAAPELASLSPIELYTVWGREVAWAPTGDRRTSDWLNRSDPIEVYSVRSLPLDGDDTEPATPPGSPPLPRSERLAADVLFVVPPALPPNRHLRLHRRVVDVRMEVASFMLIGRVHIRPGTAAGDYLLRGNRRFVPITDVELRYRGEPPFGRQISVAIVNVTHVTILERGSVAAPSLLDDPAERERPGPMLESGVEIFAAARLALQQLAELAEDGLISQAELRRKRAQILSRL
jgi:hypothetical protein